MQALFAAFRRFPIGACELYEIVSAISGCDSVRAKSGYKFVKQPNGSVAVARMAGGPGVGGTWSCDCEGPAGGPGTGDCTAQISTGGLTCLAGTCNGSCNLTVTTPGLRKAIIMY